MADTFTDKHDVVWAVERALPEELLPKFRWLMKVWNTEDDRSYEEFDPTKPYGVNYVLDDDECDECGERVDNCACDEGDDDEG